MVERNNENLLFPIEFLGRSGIKRLKEINSPAKEVTADMHNSGLLPNSSLRYNIICEVVKLR